MILLLFIDFIIGYQLHKLRPWTETLGSRLDSGTRYSIGMGSFLPMSAVNWMVFSKMTKDTGLVMHFINGALTALALGGGVILGMLTDDK